MKGRGASGTFIRCKGGYLQITPRVLADFQTYAQDTSDKFEAGGVLLGRHIMDSHDIVVDRVTHPMEEDRRTPTRFFRSRQPHQAIIDHVWRESNGTRTYLGEWHTHPELDPHPSPVDLLNWRRKLLVDRYSVPLFFVIVGTNLLRVWEGYSSVRLVALHRV